MNTDLKPYQCESDDPYKIISDREAREDMRVLLAWHREYINAMTFEEYRRYKAEQAARMEQEPQP